MSSHEDLRIPAPATRPIRSANENTDLLTVAEAARALGRHPNTVRNMIREGRLLAEEMPGRSGFRRVVPGSVRAVLAQRRGEQLRVVTPDQLGDGYAVLEGNKVKSTKVYEAYCQLPGGNWLVKGPSP